MLIEFLALTLPGQDGQPAQQITAPNGIPKGGMTTLSSVLTNGITIFLILGAIVTLIMIVTAGIQWSSSGGDKAKLQSARNRLTWAIIGFSLLLLSFFAINIVGYLFKVDLLNLSTN